MKVEYKYKKNQGWSLLSHSSSRAYLHIIGHRTWIQAEDTCQSLYGHLARGIYTCQSLIIWAFGQRKYLPVLTLNI